MKQVYIVDGSIVESQLTKFPGPLVGIFGSGIATVKKTVRYILLIFEHHNILDGQVYLLGFGVRSEVNKKMITPHSIEILLYYLIKLMDKIRYTLKYTVNIGSLTDYNIIEDIKLKHILKNIKDEYMMDFDDELVNNFLQAYYGRNEE